MKTTRLLFLLLLLLMVCACTSKITPGKYLSPDGKENVFADKDFMLEFHLKSNAQPFGFTDVKCKYSINNMSEVCPSDNLPQADLVAITDGFRWKWSGSNLYRIKAPSEMFFLKREANAAPVEKKPLDNNHVIPDGIYERQDGKEYFVIDGSKATVHILLIDDPPKYWDKEYDYALGPGGVIQLYPCASNEFAMLGKKFNCFWDGKNIRQKKSAVILFKRESLTP